MENKLLNENEINQAQGGSYGPDLVKTEIVRVADASEEVRNMIGYAYKNEAKLGNDQQELAQGQKQEQFEANHYRNK